MFSALLKKIPLILSIVALTFAVIAVGVRFLPEGPTVAQMEANMNLKMEESRKSKEEARLYACDIFATVGAKCIINRGGAFCEQRDQIEVDYRALFSGDIAEDCTPEDSQEEDPIPLRETLPTKEENPLFFGDEEVSQ